MQKNNFLLLKKIEKLPKVPSSGPQQRSILGLNVNFAHFFLHDSQISNASGYT